MLKILNAARAQGALGAVCVLVASAGYLASDQNAFWIISTLAWLFALTFFHYALANIQKLTDSNVFTLFKYAYNGVLAAILCFVALYVIDHGFHDLIFGVLFPLTVFAASIVWVVINLKLSKAANCALFSVYAWLLAVSMGANFIYGMLEALAPGVIAPAAKFTPLINALLRVVSAGVLLIAWISFGDFASERETGEVNLAAQGANGQDFSEFGSEKSGEGGQNLDTQNADASNLSGLNLAERNPNEQTQSERNLNDRRENEVNLAMSNSAERAQNRPNFDERNLSGSNLNASNLAEQGASEVNLSEPNFIASNLAESAESSQAQTLEFSAPEGKFSDENPNQRKNMQEDIYKQETLQAAKKQGIISCWLLLATFATSFLIKVYTAFSQPSAQNAELIKLADDLVSLALAVASTVYMWFALKKLADVCDTDAFDVYKRTIGACIALIAGAFVYALMRGDETQPMTAGAWIAGLFVLILAVYLVALWFKLNFALASATQNKLFKIYVFFAIGVGVAILTLQAMALGGFFASLGSALLAALAVAILYVLPTAFHLYAWTRIEDYFEA